MVKTTTLDSFQASLTDTDETVSFEPGSTDPFAGMVLEIETDEAYGLIMGKVRAWLDDRGIIAQEDEIRAKTNELYGQAAGHAQETVRDWRRPSSLLATEAEYTVAPDGTVSDYTPIEAERELPGMPAQIAVSGDVSMALKVPSDSIFGDDGEFVMSGPLANRARTLIARHPNHLEHLERLSVLYLWKKNGGKGKGRATFGKCSKPSGLLKHFSEAQFVIWLAADHCRAAGYRDRELEALLFHEMLHTGVAETDENTGRGGGAIIVPHELEVFRAEVEIYGLWAADLKAIAPAFQQAPLFGAVIEPDPTLATPARVTEIVEAYDSLPSEGVLIHDDGTPLTAEEIAELEAAELRDDPAEFEDGYPRESDLKCSVCGEAMTIESAEEDAEIAAEVAAGRTPVMLCEACGENPIDDEDDDEAGG